MKGKLIRVSSETLNWLNKHKKEYNDTEENIIRRILRKVEKNE